MIPWMQIELVQPPQNLPPSGTQWRFLLVMVLLWGYFVSLLFCCSQLWSEITGESQGLPRARSSIHSHWYTATRVRFQPWKPLPKCVFAIIKANKVSLPERALKQSRPPSCSSAKWQMEWTHVGYCLYHCQHHGEGSWGRVWRWTTDKSPRKEDWEVRSSPVMRAPTP